MNGKPTLEEEVRQLSEELHRRPFKAPESAVDAQAVTVAEHRQTLMTKAHQIHTTIISDHEGSAQMMEQLADIFDQKAKYLREMAQDVRVKSAAAAQATSDALRHERKAYAEYQVLAKGLEDAANGTLG